jgi:hypothetical protein
MMTERVKTIVSFIIGEMEINAIPRDIGITTNG